MKIFAFISWLKKNALAVASLQLSIPKVQSKKENLELILEKISGKIQEESISSSK